MAEKERSSLPGTGNRAWWDADQERRRALIEASEITIERKTA